MNMLSLFPLIPLLMMLGLWISKSTRQIRAVMVAGSSLLLVLAVLFALAVVWISKQGGWKGEGCGGNCASCHSHCEKQDPNKKA